MTSLSLRDVKSGRFLAVYKTRRRWRFWRRKTFLWRFFFVSLRYNIWFDINLIEEVLDDKVMNPFRLFAFVYLINLTRNEVGKRKLLFTPALSVINHSASSFFSSFSCFFFFLSSFFFLILSSSNSSSVSKNRQNKGQNKEKKGRRRVNNNKKMDK